jgi:hypothetical protein
MPNAQNGTALLSVPVTNLSSNSLYSFQITVRLGSFLPPRLMLEKRQASDCVLRVLADNQVLIEIPTEQLSTDYVTFNTSTFDPSATNATLRYSVSCLNNVTTYPIVDIANVTVVSNPQTPPGPSITMLTTLPASTTTVVSYSTLPPSLITVILPVQTTTNVLVVTNTQTIDHFTTILISATKTTTLPGFTIVETSVLSLSGSLITVTNITTLAPQTYGVSRVTLSSIAAMPKMSFSVSFAMLSLNSATTNTLVGLADMNGTVYCK